MRFPILIVMLFSLSGCDLISSIFEAQDGSRREFVASAPPKFLLKHKVPCPIPNAEDILACPVSGDLVRYCETVKNKIGSTIRLDIEDRRYIESDEGARSPEPDGNSAIWNLRGGDRKQVSYFTKCGNPEQGAPNEIRELNVTFDEYVNSSFSKEDLTLFSSPVLESDEKEDVNVKITCAQICSDNETSENCLIQTIDLKKADVLKYRTYITALKTAFNQTVIEISELEGNLNIASNSCSIGDISLHDGVWSAKQSKCGFKTNFDPDTYMIGEWGTETEFVSVDKDDSLTLFFSKGPEIFFADTKGLLMDELNAELAGPVRSLELHQNAAYLGTESICVRTNIIEKK